VAMIVTMVMAAPKDRNGFHGGVAPVSSMASCEAYTPAACVTRPKVKKMPAICTNTMVPPCVPRPPSGVVRAAVSGFMGSAPWM